MNRAWMVVAAAALVACGSAKDDEALHAAAGLSSTANGPGAELRLLGVTPGVYSSFAVEIESVEVSAHGKVLTTDVLTEDVDLAQTTQAWLVAKFAVPAGETELEATVKLRDGGSFVFLGGASGDLLAPCTVLHVTLPVALLNERGHAVIHVDTERSVAWLSSDAGELVPNFSLHF